MIRKILVCGVLALGIPLAGWADLVTNGGFETGNFSGWTLSGNDSFGVFVCAAGSVFQTSVCTTSSGNYAAALGPPNALAYLSQNLATTAGAQYTLTFDLRNDNIGQPASNQFSVSWGGTTLYSLTNAGQFGYQQITFSGLTATANSTQLQFAFLNNPGGFYLDGVSVVNPTGVPEPGTLTLAGTGLLIVLAGWGLRRKAVA